MTGCFQYRKVRFRRLFASEQLTAIPSAPARTSCSMVSACFWASSSFGVMTRANHLLPNLPGRGVRPPLKMPLHVYTNSLYIRAMRSQAKTVSDEDFARFPHATWFSLSSSFILFVFRLFVFFIHNRKARKIASRNIRRRSVASAAFRRKAVCSVKNLFIGHFYFYPRLFFIQGVKTFAHGGKQVNCKLMIVRNIFSDDCRH